MNRRGVWAGLASVALGGAAVFAASRVGAELAGPAPDRFLLHSERVGRDFLIEVTPPAAPLPLGHRLPIVYALDAGYHVAAGEALALQASGAMAQAFVAAIGYPPGQPNMRETDLLHRPHMDGGASHGGGGKLFEAFILDELRPAIEARYPVDPNRSILLGHSLAGLFVVNLLADHPQAFRAYLMASPSIWADPQAIARVRAAAPRGHGRLVFLTVGGAETPRMRQGVDALRAALTAPASTFVLHTRTFPGQVHMSYYPAFVEAALTDALPPGARRI